MTGGSWEKAAIRAIAVGTARPSTVSRSVEGRTRVGAVVRVDTRATAVCLHPVAAHGRAELLGVQRLACTVPVGPEPRDRPVIPPRVGVGSRSAHCRCAFEPVELAVGLQRQAAPFDASAGGDGLGG